MAVARQKIGKTRRELLMRLNVDVDEAVVRHSHTCLICGHLLAIVRTVHGLQHQFVLLR